MPFAYATMSSLKFCARSSLPDDFTVKLRACPCSTPEGRLLFAFWIALTTLSRPEPALRQRFGIEIDAHRILLRAEHLDLRDAVHHRQPLRDVRIREVVELLHRQRCATSPRGT